MKYNIIKLVFILLFGITFAQECSQTQLISTLKNVTIDSNNTRLFGGCFWIRTNANFNFAFAFMIKEIFGFSKLPTVYLTCAGVKYTTKYMKLGELMLIPGGICYWDVDGTMYEIAVCPYLQDLQKVVIAWGNVYCPTNNNTLICSGHGSCLSNNICSCCDGYTGLKCDVPPINTITCFKESQNSSSVCSGHGICTQIDKCSCEVGFSGEKCQIQEDVTPTITTFPSSSVAGAFNLEISLNNTIKPVFSDFLDCSCGNSSNYLWKQRTGSTFSSISTQIKANFFSECKFTLEGTSNDYFLYTKIIKLSFGTNSFFTQLSFKVLTSSSGAIASIFVKSTPEQIITLSTIISRCTDQSCIAVNPSNYILDNKKAFFQVKFSDSSTKRQLSYYKTFVSSEPIVLNTSKEISASEIVVSQNNTSYSIGFSFYKKSFEDFKYVVIISKVGNSFERKSLKSDEETPSYFYFEFLDNDDVTVTTNSSSNENTVLLTLFLSFSGASFFAFVLLIVILVLTISCIFFAKSKKKSN